MGDTGAGWSEALLDDEKINENLKIPGLHLRLGNLNKHLEFTISYELIGFSKVK